MMTTKNVPISLQYELRFAYNVFCFPNLRRAVAKILEVEETHGRWSLRDRKTDAFIYKTHRHDIVKTLTDAKSPDAKGYRLDLALKAKYNNVRLEYNIEKTEQETANMVTNYITNEQMRKLMNLGENDKEYRFYIFGRDHKVYTTSGFQGYLAWHRNRSPNRTIRGMRLFFDHAESNGEKVLISTVFLGIIPINEIKDNSETPPLFESMVVLPDSEIFHVWRYETYKDAEEGHTALKACSASELLLHITQEQELSQECIGYVSAS